MHIEIQKIHKRLGDKTILHNLSISIKQGQFTVLLGPSGCGKTTLLNILAGLLDIDKGQIRIGGKLYSSAGYTMPPEIRNVGMVFQDFALWPHMTIFDNTAFGLKVLGLTTKEITERVREVLKVVQMEEYAAHYPHQLSGGQKQRIAIARAMATRPEVLLMDEPLSSLDARLREQMRWDLLRIIRDTSITAVYVTHDQHEALSMADEIVLLNEGRIEQIGSPVQMYRKPDSVFAASFLGAANLLEGVVIECSHHRAVVNCSGLLIEVQDDAAVLGEKMTILIRPGEVLLDSSGSSESGTSFQVRIKQRAFHGSEWQYRVQIEGSSSGLAPFLLEVWSQAEKEIDECCELSLPKHACHVIRKKQALVEQQS
ncbi:ABC transporter ATP-binding protein [Brevibacillus reuszeri]|uniref:ABC transporter ATP-binding protein n=1 Tax=Brevibacillus reuszeri TaxID=54915 RepID=UPI003D19CC5A